MEHTLPGVGKTLLYSTPVEVADLAVTIHSGQWGKLKVNLQYIQPRATNVNYLYSNNYSTTSTTVGARTPYIEPLYVIRVS